MEKCCSMGERCCCEARSPPSTSRQWARSLVYFRTGPEICASVSSTFFTWGTRLWRASLASLHPINGLPTSSLQYRRAIEDICGGDGFCALCSARYLRQSCDGAAHYDSRETADLSEPQTSQREASQDFEKNTEIVVAAALPDSEKCLDPDWGPGGKYSGCQSLGQLLATLLVSEHEGLAQGQEASESRTVAALGSHCGAARMRCSGGGQEAVDSTSHRSHPLHASRSYGSGCPSVSKTTSLESS